jgi:hypothetical protein
VLPLVLGALAIAALGYMLLGDRFTGQDRVDNLAIEKTTKQQN